MPNLSVTIGNSFKRMKRRILVHNSSDNSDTIIPWPEENQQTRDETFDIPPNGYGGEEHFLLISIVPGPDTMAQCKFFLPVNARFTFLPMGRKELTITPTMEGRLAAIIGNGSTDWHVKISRPPDGVGSIHDPENVTVGDDGEG